MIFRFRSQIFEDRLFPVPFHVIPIVYLTMSNGIVDTVSRGLCVRYGFIADEEIKILDTAL